MKKAINGKYIIYAEVFDRKNLAIVENTENDHWVICELLQIGVVFRSSTSYKCINLYYDSNFNPLKSALYFNAARGQFYIKTANGDQHIQNEKYIEMMKEFNSSKKEDN